MWKIHNVAAVSDELNISLEEAQMWVDQGTPDVQYVSPNGWHSIRIQIDGDVTNWFDLKTGEIEWISSTQ